MSQITLAEQATPATPSSATAAMYFKSDGLMYWIDDTGTERAVSYTGSVPSFASPITITGTTLGSAAAVWIGSDGSGGGAFNVPTGEVFLGLVNNTEVTRLSSTGLAVTGALGATGKVFASTAAGVGGFSVGRRDTGGAVWEMYSSAGNWQLFSASAASDVMTVNANTAAGTINISSTGLAVTGALSASGNLTVTGGTVTTGSTTALSLATSGGTQVAIANTASANRYITLTGSNGGNPTIGTSAGRLNINSGVFNVTGIPTSSAGLSAGDVWSNSGVLTVVS